MKLVDKDRGANVRRNLRRWWKRLLVLMAGWFALAVAVCIGAIAYATTHHFPQRRTESLAQACGAVLGILLVVAGLAVLVMADRKKSQ